MLIMFSFAADVEVVVADNAAAVAVVADSVLSCC